MKPQQRNKIKKNGSNPLHAMPHARLSSCYPRIFTWLMQHKDAMLGSLKELYQTPLASLITIAVLAIAIALPSSFYLLLDNAKRLAPLQELNPRVSLYLNRTTTDTDATRLVQQIQHWPNIKSVRYISPAQGLKDLSKKLQLSHLLKNINKNPLPAVIEVQPSQSTHNPQAIKHLNFELGTLPGIEQIQLDTTWIKRLYYLLTTARHLTSGFMLLFAIGAALITTNTLRHSLEKHKKEIQILELMGAPAPMIRGPLLYRGMWLGFFSGALACIIITLLFKNLQPYVSALADTYHSQFILHSLSLSSTLQILILCTVLGQLGALSAFIWYKKQTQHA